MAETAIQKAAPSGIAAMVSDPQFLAQLRMALPRGGVTAERMSRVLLTEYRRVPGLRKCSAQSLLGALMQCAQVGLEPGPMGLAYLIPYGTECQFQLGYKGILQLLWRSDQISSVQSEVVYSNDDFRYANGIPPMLFHRPAHGERGEPIYVYAVIGTKNGGWIMRVMTADEVEEHRRRYSKAKSGPWDTAWDEMACKTVLKRTAKRAPVSAEVLLAVAQDDSTEALTLNVPIVEDDEPGPAEAAKIAVAERAAAAREQGEAEQPELG